MLHHLWRRLKPKAPDTDWTAYLDPDEELLWTGKPVPGIKVSPTKIYLSLFGVPFLLAGLVMSGGSIASALNIGSFSDGAVSISVFFFGLPFLLPGAGLVFGIWIYAAQMHNYTRYALTNKRAYIATSWWRHDLNSYPIHPDAPVHLERGKSDSLRFYRHFKRDPDGEREMEEARFDHIADGQAVYALLRQVQAGLGKGD